MKGRITIESREDFNRWLDEQYAKQEATQPEALDGTAAAAD
jgi:heme/copper-type cytochrome/quinol oxidase subunit 2